MHKWTPEEIEQYEREERKRPRLELELPLPPPNKPAKPPKQDTGGTVIVIDLF